jgi:hypothetical protein
VEQPTGKAPDLEPLFPANLAADHTVGLSIFASLNAETDRRLENLPKEEKRKPHTAYTAKMEPFFHARTTDDMDDMA